MKEEVEIWKDVDGYEGRYQVSNIGNVRSMNHNGTGKIKTISQHLSKNKYKYVNLFDGKRHKSIFVHRLVALVFVKNENKDLFTVVNHIDENKENNASTNLEWCTQKMNCNHGNHNKKLSESNKNNPKLSKMVMCLETGEIYCSMREAGDQLNLEAANICRCCRGERTTCGGLHWKYLTDN